MPRTLLLVDLTNIAMRCSLGGARPPAPSAETALNMVGRVAHALSATHAVCALDAPTPSWRRQLEPSYKAGRTLDTAPYIEAAGREACRRGWAVAQAPGFEADDLLATGVERWGEAFDIVCFTGDSDAEALARPATDLRGSVLVCWPTAGGRWELRTAADVRARHGVLDPAQLTDLKAIAGEPGDNVAGLGGRTPAGAVAQRTAVAKKLLAALHSLEGVIAAGAENASKDARQAYLKREELRHARRLVALRTDAPVFSFLDPSTSTPAHHLALDVGRAVVPGTEVRRVA